MSGYNWREGKSNNAVSAECKGLKSASTLAKLLKVDTIAIRDVMDECEWHHTSGRFNRTNYYDGRVHEAIINGNNSLIQLRSKLIKDDLLLGDIAEDDLLWKDYVEKCHQELEKMISDTRLRKLEKNTSNRFVIDCTITNFKFVNRKWKFVSKREYFNVNAVEKGSFLEIELADRIVRKKKDSNGFDWQIVKKL